MERGDLNLKLYLDEQNQIAGLGFTPVTEEKKEAKPDQVQVGRPESRCQLLVHDNFSYGSNPGS